MSVCADYHQIMNKTASFRDKVYAIVKRIPKGKVATYGQVAKLAGNPRAARAVGMFMKTNPYAPIVPCHRVVASNGGLTGYSGRGGVRGKKKMLLNEGVKFKRECVDLNLSLWSA